MAISSSTSFVIEINESIAHILLNCPEKHNALSPEFFIEMGQAFNRLSKDETVKVIVISAMGPSFTSGLDLDYAGKLMESKGARGRNALFQTIRSMQEGISAIEKCRKPVIAAIHGYCIGAGVDLTSACDIRWATQDAIFSIRETRMAIVADFGTLQRLAHIVGQGWTRDLSYTGRNFSSKEAFQMGFITRISENHESLLNSIQDLAFQISENSPRTVQGVKEVLNFSRDYGIQAGLDFVAQKNAATLISSDLKEVLKAYSEKRKPIFK